jgi:probable F420-dependent oxidoreductase
VDRVTRIAVSVQAEPRDLGSWLALARRLESSRFDALLMGDHPGSGASPWPALGAAATATDRLRLGTYVLQCGVREPMHIAADAATLDLLAPGRVMLGLGAGHTPLEWTDVGRRRPSPQARVARLVEVFDAVARLLAGETTTFEGSHVSLDATRLDGFPPLGHVTLTVGGGHPDLLRFGAERADIVALSGLGRTLPDGHRHEVTWSPERLHAQLKLIRDAAKRADRTPTLDALVQQVTVTRDRSTVFADLASRLAGNPLVEHLAATPFLLVGTHEEIAQQMVRQAEQWGISRYVVREPAVPDLEPVLTWLQEAGNLSGYGM